MLTSPSMTVERAPILIFMKSEPLALSLEKAFRASGHQTTMVTSESAAFTATKDSPPSLIILDRQCLDPITLRHLRTAAAIPVVVVANGGCCPAEECLQDYEHEVDLVLYNQTPRQLVARVRAILRRGTPGAQVHRHYRVGKIQMDLDRHEVTISGHLVELTPKEFKILHQFLETPGRVFSRQEMLNNVWGEGYALEEHALDVHIHSLRQKIETDPSEPAFIMTVRGVGYKLRT
jgi:two-component system, OmpR family, response regulator RegX3